MGSNPNNVVPIAGAELNSKKGKGTSWKTVVQEMGDLSKMVPPVKKGQAPPLFATVGYFF